MLYYNTIRAPNSVTNADGSVRPITGSRCGILKTVRKIAVIANAGAILRIQHQITMWIFAIWSSWMTQLKYYHFIYSYMIRTLAI